MKKKIFKISGILDDLIISEEVDLPAPPVDRRVDAVEGHADARARATELVRDGARVVISAGGSGTFMSPRPLTTASS